MWKIQFFLIFGCCQIFVILRRPLLTALQHTVSPVTIDLLYTDCKATVNRYSTVISIIFFAVWLLLQQCLLRQQPQQTTNKKNTNATINNLQKISTKLILDQPFPKIFVLSPQ